MTPSASELAELLEERDLSAGETLFVEGEEADALVLVAARRVELATRRGVETIAVGAGRTLGLLALFAVGARETSAVGVDASDLRLLRREEFLRFAEDHPRAAFRIARRGRRGGRAARARRTHGRRRFRRLTLANAASRLGRTRNPRVSLLRESSSARVS